VKEIDKRENVPEENEKEGGTGTAAILKNTMGGGVMGHGLAGLRKDRSGETGAGPSF